MDSRTQGPRPRTQKKSEAKAKDRPSRGQEPRTQAQLLSKKKSSEKSSGDLQKKGLQKKFSGDLPKKRSSEKMFMRSPEKNVFQKIFQALHKLLTTQEIVLPSSRGQRNFRGLEASRPRT